MLRKSGLFKLAQANGKPDSEQPNEDSKRKTKSDEKVSAIDTNSRAIAVFTSGGDSQGMNAAVRAVVRMGRLRGCLVFFIKEGYQGMVDGGNHIVKATSADVYGIIHKGGTVIGSARCKQFMERSGRLTAALNLIEHKITNLVVIGGDGSLTGANLFRQEWPSLLEELVSTGKIKAEQKEQCSHLNIVGMVGSIDNDFCGTDMTIGTDSALHRIIEAIDAIATTAHSHRRTFILEVMGRHCGYLALVAALASGADYAFIPEYPPEAEWPTKLCKKLKQERDMGHRLNIIIVAEGAIDRNGQPITADNVKDIVKKAGHDARVTVLGHIQRGGFTSAFDRVMASYLGAEAITTLLEAKPDTEAKVMALKGGKVARVGLMESVDKTKAVAAAMKNMNWDEAIKLRGQSFETNFEVYKMLARLRTQEQQKDEFKVAILQVGPPCSGMNAAIRSFVRTVIHNGGTPTVILDGIDGLLSDKIKNINWSDVNGWVGRIGSYLGCGVTTVDKNNVQSIVKRLSIVQGLLVIGGFEAFRTIHMMTKEKELKIPICLIPAATSNNVPGSDFSLGADTALNGITDICDRIRLSSRGTTGRVFIIELDTGYCAYLPLTAALAAGADRCYKFGDKITENEIRGHARKLKKKMQRDNRNRIILMNSQTDSNLKSRFPGMTRTVVDIYSKEGKGVYSVEREFISSNVQQPTNVSPFDRILGTKVGVKSANWIHEQIQQKSQKIRAVVIGLNSNEYTFQDIDKLSNNIDFEHGLPKDQWFLHLNSLIYDTL